MIPEAGLESPLVACILFLALQADSFEGLFGSDRGAAWTYRRTEAGAESRIVLTLLKREDRKLTFDEKETREGRSDPRAVTVILSIAGGFLTLERRVDDEPPVSSRLYKLGSKEGDSWEGIHRLKDDGKAIRLKSEDTEYRLSQDQGLTRIEKPGNTMALLEVARTSWTPIDLSAKHNAALTKAWHPPGVPESEFNDLSSLPRGVQKLDDVPFDIRGVVQLAGQAAKAFPEKVEGIDVRCPAARLHFLHATGWSAAPGTPIARFVVHFKDGKSVDVPVVFGEDVGDWWQYPHTRFKGTRGKVAWIGSNPACRALGASLKIYKTTWENPTPEVEIVSVDYASSMTPAAPFLVALTAEKK